jgi:hypothetical protein
VLENRALEGFTPAEGQRPLTVADLISENSRSPMRWGIPKSIVPRATSFARGWGHR